MDITLGLTCRPIRVVFELYANLCPKTCENFRALCVGSNGKSAEGVRLTYRGSLFHRVVQDGWVQGGDIVSGAGDGGVSIYGDTFADETFTVKFDEPGVLAMANNGPHTNASQFFITLAEQPWMNHRAVGFGRVIKGMQVLHQMSEMDTLNQRPLVECKIAKAGELSAEDFATVECK
ncbi:unnamed protein product [Choristocarpus tenellus]